MKALTLWQPWATLVAIGAKQYETRSWRPSTREIEIGDLFVIHAAKRFSPSERTLCSQPPFASALRVEGYDSPQDLPLGAGLCVVKLMGLGYTEEVGQQVSDHELAFGDYTPGRWAWRLEIFIQFGTPIYRRGYQGVWNWPDLEPDEPVQMSLI